MRHKKFSSVGKDLTQAVYDGNIYLTKRKITQIVLHCSASDYHKNFTATDIDKWHQQRWGSGCGYHYVILLDGTIEKGRWVDYPGAHVKGHNRNSIGICYIGGVDENNNVVYDYETQEQHESMLRLIKLLCESYSINPQDHVLGHNEFQGVNKQCPCLDMDNLRSELYKD
jgi:N-acetylmuramoyl-L-alanine amidase